MTTATELTTETIPTAYLAASDGTCANGYTDCRNGVCLLIPVPATHDKAHPLASTAEFIGNTQSGSTTPPTGNFPKRMLYIPSAPANIGDPVPKDSVFRIFPQKGTPTAEDLRRQLVLNFETVTPGKTFPVQIWVETDAHGNTIYHVDRQEGTPKADS